MPPLCRISPVELKGESLPSLTILTTVLVSSTSADWSEGGDESAESTLREALEATNKSIFSYSDFPREFLHGFPHKLPSGPRYDQNLVKIDWFATNTPANVQISEVLELGNDLQMAYVRNGREGKLIGTAHGVWFLNEKVLSCLLVFLDEDYAFVPVGDEITEDLLFTQEQYALTLAVPVAFVQQKLSSRAKISLRSSSSSTGKEILKMEIITDGRTESVPLPPPDDSRIIMPDEWKRAVQKIEGFWRSEYESEWDKWWGTAHLNAPPGDGSEKPIEWLANRIRERSRDLAEHAESKCGKSFFTEGLTNTWFLIREEPHPLTGAMSFRCVRWASQAGRYQQGWLTRILNGHVLSRNNRRLVLDDRGVLSILQDNSDAYPSISHKSGWSACYSPSDTPNATMSIGHLPDASNNYATDMLRVFSFVVAGAEKSRRGHTFSVQKPEARKNRNPDQLMLIQKELRGKVLAEVALPLPRADRRIGAAEWKKALQKLKNIEWDEDKWKVVWDESEKFPSPSGSHLAESPNLQQTLASASKTHAPEVTETIEPTLAGTIESTVTGTIETGLRRLHANSSHQEKKLLQRCFEELMLPLIGSTKHSAWQVPSYCAIQSTGWSDEYGVAMATPIGLPGFCFLEFGPKSSNLRLQQWKWIFNEDDTTSKIEKLSDLITNARKREGQLLYRGALFCAIPKEILRKLNSLIPQFTLDLMRTLTIIGCKLPKGANVKLSPSCDGDEVKIHIHRKGAEEITVRVKFPDENSPPITEWQAEAEKAVGPIENWQDLWNQAGGDAPSKRNLLSTPAEATVVSAVSPILSENTTHLLNDAQSKEYSLADAQNILREVDKEQKRKPINEMKGYSTATLNFQDKKLYLIGSGKATESGVRRYCYVKPTSTELLFYGVTPNHPNPPSSYLYEFDENHCRRGLRTLEIIRRKEKWVENFLSRLNCTAVLGDRDAVTEEAMPKGHAVPPEIRNSPTKLRTFSEELASKAAQRLPDTSQLL